MRFSTKTKAPHPVREQGGVPLLEAATFWPRNKDGPLYRALIHYHANRELRHEAKIREEKGLGAFVRATHRRLHAMENGRGSYTRTHSREVGTFAWTIITEAIQRKLPVAEGIDPAHVFAGGYGHDVGKTMLPQALLAKEGGIEVCGVKLLLGVKLTIVERSTLRHQHIGYSSDFGKIFWDRADNAGFNMVQDMIDRHHVTYNGLDGAYPSYPLGKRGMDLPFHCRIAKAADFLSAVLPRPYRPVYQQQWITEFEQAIGYAIMVAGTELDPVTVSCLLTGMYDIRANEADSLVENFRYNGPQNDLADMKLVKNHVVNIIGKAQEFVDAMKRRDHTKIVVYTDKICDCAEKFGIQIAPDFPK